MREGRLNTEDRWLRLTDVDTGKPVPDGRGSVHWNEFRQRWVQLVSGSPGEVWFAEADTPVGPWVYARRVVTHGEYNFYNPTQHPYFDQDEGRLVYFEGTYTASFSGAKVMTPRYDYNQLMYRLDLADPRLDLPVPVYRVDGGATGERLVTRPIIEREDLWSRVRDVAFFAMPTAAHGIGCVLVYDDGGGGLTVTPTRSDSAGLFMALSFGSVEPSRSPGMVPLYQSRKTAGHSPAPLVGRGGAADPPLGWVWARPPGVVPWDATIRAMPERR